MIFRDYCKRIVRQICGEAEWIYIPRHQCDNPGCEKIHRMLPDFLVPFKHYEEEVISDCVDERLNEDDTDGNPSRKTIERWKLWIILNALDIDGLLKSIGHRELGFSVELMKSGVSLLKELQRSIPDGWLKTILRIIYNTGAYLVPFYE